MKICIICDVLGQENNGTTIAAYNLIRYLVSNNHEVRIVCSNQDKKNLKGYYIVPRLNIPIVNYILNKNGVSLSRVNKKVLLDAMKDVDHVHCLVPFRLSHFASEYCKKNNISCSASFHCQAENFSSHLGLKNCNFLSNIIYRFYNCRVYKNVDVIHYPTNFIKNVFENVVGPTNGVVISNGVNDIYKKKNVIRNEKYKDKFIILNIGRLCSEKNQQVLIKAISLSKYKDKIQLICAGSGPDKKKLFKLANKLKVNLENNFYSREELVNIINSADLYCHTSEMEIEAISCIEAFSCGLVPVIADSNKSATREFAIDDKSLFKNNDEIDLARKIDYWIENPDVKSEYSKKYQESSFKFDQVSCMEKMEDMILKSINKKKVQYEKSKSNIL